MLPVIDFSVFPSLHKLKIFDFLTILIVPIYFQSSYYHSLPIRKKLVRVFTIILAVMIISAFFSLNFNNSLLSIISFTNYLIFFVIVSSYIYVNRSVMDILKFVQYSAWVSIAALCVQFFLGVEFSIYSELNQNVLANSQVRYTGPFHDPQKFGLYLSAIFYLSLFWFSSKKVMVLTKSLILLILLLALGLTGSRGALLGLIIGLLYLFLKTFIVQKQFSKAIILLISAIFGTALIQRSLAFERILSASLEQDVDFRYDIWIKASRIYLENPIFGIGPGGYQNYVSKYDQSQYWVLSDGDYMYFDHPESTYLLWLVEYGSIAFLIIIILILMVFNPFKRCLWTLEANRVSYIEAGLLSLLVGFATIYPLGDRRIGIIFLILLSFLFVFKFSFFKRQKMSYFK